MINLLPYGNFICHVSGVRVDTPIYSEISSVEATDPDADSVPVHYSIENITFFRPRTETKEILDRTDVFLIDSATG